MEDNMTIDLSRLENRIAVIKGRGNYTTDDVIDQVMSLKDYNNLDPYTQTVINVLINTLLTVIPEKKNNSENVRNFLKGLDIKDREI